MSFTTRDIKLLQEMFTASESRILTAVTSSIQSSERTLRDEIKEAIHKIRIEFKEAMKEANENQTQLLIEMIGSLADNLDDAYAGKQTDEHIEKITEHLRATP